jgi:hypothetical protein
MSFCENQRGSPVTPKSADEEGRNLKSHLKFETVDSSMADQANFNSSENVPPSVEPDVDGIVAENCLNSLNRQDNQQTEQTTQTQSQTLYQPSTLHSSELNINLPMNQSDNNGSPIENDYPVPTSLDDLVSILHRELGDKGIDEMDKVNVARVKAIMENYSSNFDDWKQYAYFDHGRYTRNLVDKGGFLFL